MKKIFKYLMMLISILVSVAFTSSCKHDHEDDLTPKNSMTIDGVTYPVDFSYYELWEDNRSAIVIGDLKRQVCALLEFEGSTIPTGKNVPIVELDIMDESDEESDIWGINDLNPTVDITKKGDIYTITIKDQPIFDDTNYKFKYKFSASYTGTLKERKW